MHCSVARRQGPASAHDAAPGRDRARIGWQRGKGSIAAMPAAAAAIAAAPITAASLRTVAAALFMPLRRRWPMACGALAGCARGASICGRAAVRCAWAAPDCRDRVPAAACGAAGPVREPAAAPGPAGEEAAPRGPAAARRARSGAGRGRRGSGPDAARCWCCASRNRCGDRLAGRRRDSVRHRAGSRRPARPCSMKARRAALVVLEELPAIGAGRAREELRGGGRDVGFVARGGLARVGHAPDAVRTAVVADAAVVDVVDHYVVRIHVGDMRDVHIGHRAVVEVAVVVPVAAHETDADITEAVVDAAVEADVRPQ